jgi:hypothetical protein
MKIDASVGNKPADVFKTFPEFSKLTLADRTKYEALICDLPPYSLGMRNPNSDYAFPTLMNWWNSLDSCAVSMLNGNLIISYWIPGMDVLTGISLVGTNKVDESICYIFDSLKSKGETPQLVHVPEFVIGYMEHPELFTCISQRNTDEYVIPVDKFYPIKHSVSFRRHRVNKFLRNMQGSKIVVKSIDLSLEDNRFLLTKCANTWPAKGPANTTVSHSDDGMAVSINEADRIGTENLCLFVDDKLQAFILYTQPSDKRYVIFSHYRSNDDLPYVLDYVLYSFAEWFNDQGVRYVNLDGDLGLWSLRMLKLALGPCEFFRKYTIKPAE